MAWEFIRTGHLPLWNPLVGMGAPLLANYQSALLYPPNWLLFILDEIGNVGWAAWGQGLLVAIHLAWAGLGMYVLGGKLGLGSLSRTVCGLAFGLSGYLVGRSSFLSINSAVAWLPWVLVYSVSYDDRVKISDRHTMKLGLVFTFQLLAGHAQITWYTILLTFMWAGMWNWHTSHSQIRQDTYKGIISRWQARLLGVKRVLREWVRIITALGVASLLSAIQLIPTVEYLLQSHRSNAIDYDFAMTYSFWPWRILTLLAPGMFGSPVSGDYWGYGNYWEDALYIGLLPLFLAISMMISGILKKLKPPDSGNVEIDADRIRYKSIRFLMVLIVVSMILALGNRTPIYPWLYKNIPTMAMFQAPTRFSIWAVFALSLLAGIGIETWRRPSGRALYWVRLGMAGAVAIALGSGVTWVLLGEVSPTFIRATALLGLFGLGVVFLTLTMPEIPKNNIGGLTIRRSIWEWGVIGFLMIDLLVANWGLLPGIDRDFYTESFTSEFPLLGSSSYGERLFLPESDEYKLKFERYFRFKSYISMGDLTGLRYVMLPNLNLLARISSVNNFDPLIPYRYERWMKALNLSYQENDGEEINYLLNLMNVSVVENMDNSASKEVSYSRRSGMERMRWVPCSLPANSDENAWDLIFNQHIDYDIQVVIETDDLTSFDNCSKDASSQHKFEITTETPNQLSMTTETVADGWLVLSDVWYPGWRAYIGQQEVSIIRANYLFKAIQLPAGVHEVTFTYKPSTFYAGIAVSLVSCILVFIGYFVLYKRDRA
ncbi:MAG: YfhO family protein [Anaerolineales bacterium]|nr:MAG: YfhO family protein [Anaerolineales bacterium]